MVFDLPAPLARRSSRPPGEVERLPVVLPHVDDSAAVQVEPILLAHQSSPPMSVVSKSERSLLLDDSAIVGLGA